MSTGKVIVGTMAGLAVGTVLGILFAPDKGSVTRKQIMDKGNDCVDGLKSKYKELADTVKEQFESIKGEISDLTADVKSKYEDAKTNASNR